MTVDLKGIFSNHIHHSHNHDYDNHTLHALQLAVATCIATRKRRRDPQQKQKENVLNTHLRHRPTPLVPIEQCREDIRFVSTTKLEKLYLPISRQKPISNRPSVLSNSVSVVAQLQLKLSMQHITAKYVHYRLVVVWKYKLCKENEQAFKRCRPKQAFFNLNQI